MLKRFAYPGLLIATGLLIALAAQQTLAATPSALEKQASAMHPTFALLDAEGNPALKTGEPLSTEKTCGVCHDTAFITTHSFHADLGYSDKKPENAHPWDLSDGLYGKWNPIIYRYLSAPNDERVDLTPTDWLQLNAARIVGGGPTKDVGLEMDCFLCHFTNPNNAERVAAIQNGNFAWANTASLLGAGIVAKSAAGYTYVASAFDAEGQLQRAFITIQDPSNANCAQCHGVAHTTPDPLTLTGRDLTQWQTATTGQIVSPQKISQSGMNLAGKATLARSWDIHAERGLQCVDCHYSLNNPALTQTNAKAQPDHILFDPRRLDFSEYLQKPSHQFARGQSAQFTAAPDLKGTMRRCESCHETTLSHSWLPYTDQHMRVVACESCHIPKLYAPAVQAVDWTVLQSDGSPVTEWRGVNGDSGTLNDLITGFTPILLQRAGMDGKTTLAPYNLVTAWYWVYDSANGERPARLADLQAAYFENGQYRPEIVQALDANGDKTLTANELRLDTSDKQALIAQYLQALGLNHPRLASEIQPYSINHNVARGDYAIRDCAVCHGDDSRVTSAMTLATGGPAGVTPQFVKDVNTAPNGSIAHNGDQLTFAPAPEGVYVFGHDRVAWVDWLGVVMVLGVLIAVTTHGGLRYYSALKLKGHARAIVKQVYMYAVYERFWHWLQTFAILLLIFTGLVIHRPEMFGVFSFQHIVVAHNVLAVILVLNAALSLFYHLVSGEIQQYLPRPYGFFDQAIVQARYYAQGIFRRDPHPFEKTPQRKLNPLQQVTYFGILNVLLPLQVITGALMWGVQAFPHISQGLGGLPFLAPFHSLVAWSFMAFIIAHVYLTTTGHEPLASLKAMMLGWDEVEERSAVAEAAAPQPSAGD
jgi:thiosulfate reductase cytochrome b subunit